MDVGVAPAGDGRQVLQAYPNVEVQDQTAFREKYATFLNQVLNLLTALLLMAVIIAVFGIVKRSYLSIYERTRELGLLRAVGSGAVRPGPWCGGRRSSSPRWARCSAW